MRALKIELETIYNSYKSKQFELGQQYLTTKEIYEPNMRIHMYMHNVS